MAEHAEFSDRGSAGDGRDGAPSRASGSDAPARLPPGIILRETYHIIRRLSQGGMGEVYEASHTRLAGRYAVKVLRGDLSQDLEATLRFRREAQITSRLRHPGIVSVLDFATTDEGEPYIVMEFLEGEDLGKLLDREAPRPRAWIADVVSQIAAALGAAHAQGVVHRDLKPQNVFLVPRGPGQHLVKVVDFGISKMHALSQRLTRESTLLGTPPYMSPEQAIGRADDVDARADQFALATLTYELVTGRRPFDGENVMALFYQIVNVTPPPMGTWAQAVPAAAEAVVRKGLAKDRNARFPNIEAFAAAFAEAISLPEGAADPATSRLAPSRPAPAPGGAPPARRWAWPAMGVLLALGAAGAAWRSWPAATGSIPGSPSRQAESQVTERRLPTAVAMPPLDPAAVVTSPLVPPVAPPAAAAIPETAPTPKGAQKTPGGGHGPTHGPARARKGRGATLQPSEPTDAPPTATEPPPPAHGGTILRDL